MIAAARAGADRPVLTNFHNQAVTRASYQGPRGPGFSVEFLPLKAQRAFDDAIELGVVALKASTVAAVVATGDEIKRQLRTYFDGVFLDSGMTGNAHRRATNAMVQSVTYEEIEAKGQFTYLIYSKLGRGMGPGSFVDYLLRHLQGGAVVPQKRDWLRISVSQEDGALRRQGGFVPTGRSGDTSVFFAKGKADPDKLFLLRRSSRTGKTQLLDVLLKSVRIRPRLGGLQQLLEGAEAVFDRNLDVTWRRESAKGAG